MDKVFEANVSATPPTPGTANGYPTDGDLSTGTPATIPGAYAFWMLFKELLNLIEAAELAPDVNNLGQVSQAVQAFATAAQTAAIAAATSLAANAQAAAIAEAGALADAAQAAAIAQAGTLATQAKTDAETAVLGWFTSGQTLAATGYQKLPGGLILQWGITASIAPNTDTPVTFPIAFPSACYGMQATCDYTGGNATDSDLYGMVQNITTTGATVARGQNGGGPNGVVYWSAVGK